MKQTHPEQPSGTMTTPCKVLRSKEMFYEAPDQESDDAFASGAYWCGKTQEPFGPDGEPAEKEACQCGRSCYIGG